jgi:hypothetical protein
LRDLQPSPERSARHRDDVHRSCEARLARWTRAQRRRTRSMASCDTGSRAVGQAARAQRFGGSSKPTICGPKREAPQATRTRPARTSPPVAAGQHAPRDQ